MDRTIVTSSILMVAVGIVAANDQFDAGVATDQAIDPAGREFFENHIRPVLADHCYKCHSSKSIRVRAELLLDSRQGVLKGGEGGSVLVPGQPEYQLLASGNHMFVLKDLDGYKAQFSQDDEGNISELSMIQPNGTFKAKKK